MEKYLNFKTTGNFEKDIESYFLMHGREDTYEHTLDVVQELHDMEKYFGDLEQGSEVACYCHDLGRVVKNNEIIQFCEENNIEITDEEKLMPSILHQKISKFIAERIFNIKDDDILNAIRYHTTSRKETSKIEMEVFLSDKLSWKDDDYIKIVNGIRQAIKYPKEKAMLYYLSELESNKGHLVIYHKDAQEAYEYFKKNVGK